MAQQSSEMSVSKLKRALEWNMRCIAFLTGVLAIRFALVSIGHVKSPEDVFALISFAAHGLAFVGLVLLIVSRITLTARYYAQKR